MKLILIIGLLTLLLLSGCKVVDEGCIIQFNTTRIYEIQNIQDPVSYNFWVNSAKSSMVTVNFDGENHSIYLDGNKII